MTTYVTCPNRKCKARISWEVCLSDCFTHFWEYLRLLEKAYRCDRMVELVKREMI